MNRKGQYFEGYDLLISMIFAIAVLGIILGVIVTFDNLRQSVCERRFVEGLQSAVNSPDGSVIKVPNCVFPLQSFTPHFLAQQQSAVPEQCFTLQGLNSSAQTVQNNSIRINQSFEQSSYFKCEQGTSGCDVSCVVSFGQELK